MNNLLDEQYRDLWQILNGYFHQDAVSVEKGIEELIEGTSKSYKQKIIHEISKFIEDKKFNQNEKIQFIERNNSFILSESPLAWLQHVAEELEKSIKA